MIEQKAPLGFPEALIYLNSDSGDGNNLNRNFHRYIRNQ